MIELDEIFELYEIWRIQQKNVLLSVKITFQDTYSEGLIIFFVSNNLQESIKNTYILASLSTDYSPISFAPRRAKAMVCGSLNKEFVKKNERTHLEKENVLDDQVIWEYL